MTLENLVVGKKYWCGWASRRAVYIGTRTVKWGSELITEVRFRDICGAYIECSPEAVKEWGEER
ncbi:hypothetical protein D7X94_16625 [Acutalibacter sp. 1XD8-33]|uniref:hypothetical protein n=1 Tax=Acutalibacter sp. 1XD8-33 TaxID=2320081 RepID=UPI000EA02AAF|nr:hypothetical protein [Acutalibacter sp. 1XD8-33]RKJ38387.1 hypothetical protein D7X94_16625 [Acutalibacter sp. 1XD8-33]